MHIFRCAYNGLQYNMYHLVCIFMQSYKLREEQIGKFQIMHASCCENSPILRK